MRYRVTILSAAMLFAHGVTARADSMSGNDFIAYCTSADSVRIGYCLGYVTGVIDGTTVGAFDRPFFCLPEAVTVGQVKDMALKVLDRTPEVRHQPARMTIIVELNKQFPCSSRPPK